MHEGWKRRCSNAFARNPAEQRITKVYFPRKMKGKLFFQDVDKMKKTKNVLDMPRCVRGDKDRASEFGVMRQEVESNSDLERSRHQMRKV